MRAGLVRRNFSSSSLRGPSSSLVVTPRWSVCLLIEASYVSGDRHAMWKILHDRKQHQKSGLKGGNPIICKSFCFHDIKKSLKHKKSHHNKLIKEIKKILSAQSNPFQCQAGPSDTLSPLFTVFLPSLIKIRTTLLAIG